MANTIATIALVCALTLSPSVPLSNEFAPTCSPNPEHVQAAPEVEQYIPPAVTKPASQTETEQYIPPAVTKSANISNEECWRYIMHRESRGNIHAENGRYKGLFQLDKTYYPRYVGKTWEECRDSWDLQFAAAEGYMLSRYGTWQKAYIHSRNFGWW